MNDVRIGVDLGTCYSSVGYDDHHSLRFMQDPAAPQLTYSIPSCALLREDDDSFVFGELAEAERNATPEGYQPEFKRDLGSSAPYWLRDRQISAAELTAEFLKFLVHLTETTLAAAPASAVITVPAYYDPYRRSLIDDAARQARLAETSLVAEPVAAVASAAERGEVTGDTTTLVYDLGGGTFDAAVVRLDGGKQEVLGAKGLPDFGGTDIDLLIEQDFAREAGDEFADMLAGQDADDPKRRAQALRARIEAREFCRKIKHRLSSADHASDLLLLKFRYELSRRELEDMVRPYLDRTVSTCRELLASIALTPDQIDTVLLVGGASRMPMVREVVATALDRPVRPAADPELAVCRGAAILARTGPPQAAKHQAQEQARRESQEAAKRQAEEQARTEARERAKREAEEQAKRQAGEPGRPQAAVERGRSGLLFSGRGGGQSAQFSPAHLKTITAPKAVHAVAFSPDATRLALGCADRLVLITDLAGRQQLKMSHGWVNGPVWDVAYDPEGRRLASVGSDKIARIWDASTGRPLRKIKAHVVDRIFGVAFSPDGGQLATAGVDKTARTWDASTGRGLLTMTHADVVRGVAFSPDGGRLATASFDGTARIWDLSTRRILLTITYRPDTNRVCGVAFSPDGARLATGSHNTSALIWDANTGRELLKVTHTAGVNRVAFSPDGSLLATASGGKTALIWDANTGRELLKVTHTAGVSGVAFSRDGSLFATASNDKTVQLWRLNKVDNT